MLERQLIRAVIPRSIRNIVRAPAASMRWAQYSLRHLVGLDESLELRPGFVLRSHPAAHPVAYHAQRDDPEQVAEFDRFVAECEPGMRLLDIGAHFGLFSLAALHYGGPTASAVAVDASPVAIRMTRVQARLNGVADRLACVQAAAGAAVGWTELLSTGPMGAGYFLPDLGDHPASDRTRTPLTTIDALARTYGTPTHVKVDVESFEADVLRGGRETLTAATRPRLYLELHNEMVAGRGGEPGEAVDLLAAYGYEMFGLDGRRLGRAEVLAPALVRILCRPARAA